MTISSLEISGGESASSAEMRFAGHYLNLGGILLVLMGLASYLKSSGASSGVLESLLGAGLGLVLLIAGENFFRKGMQEYSHPVLTGGFCLLFFSICSAHFRHGLIGVETLFAALLPVVIGSNASVFRYDSKLIGNVMLVVYFFTPFFITFSFEHFTAIFFYLLAVNLGTALVAFVKKWDFQLIVASLGSYALYFTQFRGESRMNSLLFLLMIYALSLAASTVLYFKRPENSDYNRVLSLINPSVFAALSSLVVLGLPNRVPVLVYLGLAAVHGVVAKLADARRLESPNFRELANTNLALAILFMSASISFVTYFSTENTYFGLVTTLWFTVALLLLRTSFTLVRHCLLLSRFSYFALALASAQVLFVLPTMESSLPLQALAIGLYGVYFTLLYRRRDNLSREQVGALRATAVLAAVIITQVLVGLVPGQYLMIPLIGLAMLALAVSVKVKLLSEFAYLAHGLAGAGVWCSLRLWSMPELSWLLVPACTLALGFTVQWALARGSRLESLWIWVGLLVLRTALLPWISSINLTMLSLAAAYLVLTWLGGTAERGMLLGHMREVASFALLLFFAASHTLHLPTMAGLGVLLGLSHALAHSKKLEYSSWSAIPHLIMLTRVCAVSFAPYPLACLAALALLGVLLMKLGQSKLSLALQALVALGALMVPMKIQPLEWLILAWVMVSFLINYTWSKDDPIKQAGAGLGVLSAIKLSLMLHLGPLSTLCWSLMALSLLQPTNRQRNWNQLGQGLFDYSRVLYAMAFVKSIVIDANFVGQISIFHYPASALVVAVFLYTGHKSARPQVRNSFVLSGLLIFAFQMTFVLHESWGTLLMFQPLLSGFWAFTAFLVIASGIALRIKVYRLFGLVTLVANTLKILMVDIHVLDAYSQTNTYLILGSLLMMTSLLYQKQKSRLCSSVAEPPLGAPIGAA